MGPETPTKADDEIRRITSDLSAKWGLRFPAQVLQSPAKRDRERPEEQVLSRLRWLFFHDRRNNQAATNYAIQCFERFAPKLLTGWIAKPRAEEDVLPTRTRSEAARRQEFLSRKPTLSDEQASDLMQALLRYLSEAIDAIRKGAIFTIEEESQYDYGHAGLRHGTPKNQNPQPLRRSSRTSSSKTVRKVTSPLKNGNIKAYLSKKGDDPPPVMDTNPLKIQQPSSDEYKVDDGLFDDVEMQDAPDTAFSSNAPATALGPAPDFTTFAPDPDELLEEFYQTPPDSPSKIRNESSRTYAIQESLYPMRFSAQGSDSRCSSDTVVPYSRKRGLPASSKPEMPRKMSRDASERRSTGIGPAQPKGGLRYIGDPEFNKAILDRQESFGALQKSWSAESLSSVTSSAAIRPLSAWTTPNTSFLTETPATSFDSSQEPFELDYLRQKPVHARRSWQNLKAPFGLGLDMDMDVEVPEQAEVGLMGPPAPVLKYKSPPTVSVRNMLSASPFATVNPSRSSAIHLRQLYELCRISIQTDIPLQNFGRCLDQASDDYESLWLNMATVAGEYQAAMPEKSSSVAWKHSEHDFKGVALTGSLNFVDQPGDRVFEFKLNPLKTEPTYRLARKFGSDRFFLLSVPSIDSKDLPDYLQADPNARDAILEWLLHTEHTFLGRKWRAFYVKAESRRKAGVSGPSKLGDIKHCHRVYFFAETGYDFQARRKGGEKDPRVFNHLPMTRRELVDWFMPAKENKSQRALKFFARLALGVSQTAPSVQFRPTQIIRSDDAFADAPAVRRLDLKRSHEKKTKRKPVHSKSPVMNDGCARISRRAAKEVADSIHLNHTPSIFQGRIAGAKGVWMVDTLDETVEGPDGDFWIEITDSQLKFEASGEDELYPDPERVTFEVHSHARSLISATLNFQLMPILADRETPFQIFSDLLEADLTAKVAELEAAMESGLAIRKWNEDVNPVMSERAAYGVEMHGGLPSSLPEKINWFVEHGFEPKDCCRLKDFLYDAISDYCLRLENRMNIGVAKSTYAFMIADPLAVLEEGEVHICFSTPFDNELMLHDIDVLVARLPAALPSDVRKVRAVFKPELRAYRDVIVFPSKGSQSLASILSGGDYDGDRAWICWEPSIVTPFRNAPLPSSPPPLSDYGIETDQTTVSDLLNAKGTKYESNSMSSSSVTRSHDDYMDRFLHHAFSFTLQPNFLGICTAYFESLCYVQNSISHPSAIKMAHLLSHLVDRAKAGIIFSDSQWTGFLNREGLPRNLPKPAYKDKEKGVYDKKKNHLIDRLVFETAKGVRERVLHGFSTRFKDAGTYDADLVALYKNETVEAKNDSGIARALKDLKLELEKLRDVWSAQCSRGKDIMAATTDDFSPMKKGKGGKRKSGAAPILSFQAVAEQIRDGFLAIRPSDEAIALSPVVARWARDAFPTASTSAATSFSSSTTSSFPKKAEIPAVVSSSNQNQNHNHWTLLKSSLAFSTFHASKFVWYACGVELGILKARSLGSRHVVVPIWECMRLDGKAVRRRMMTAAGDGGRGGAEEEGEEEEEEYGDWGWVEGMEV